MKYIFIVVVFLVLNGLFSFKLKAATASIFISEILPDALGADAGKEWIELYNNLDEPLNLKDYYFINRSLSGTERKVAIVSSLNIPAKQYYLISEGAQNISSENILILGSGKLNMFNDESDLELYDPDGALVDKVHYLKPIEAKSLERKGPLDILDCNKLVANQNGNTILTDNLARDPVCFGQIPVSAPTEPSLDKCISIGLITSNLIDSTICTRGFVTVEPETLGDKVFYIEDGGLGLKVKLKVSPTIILKLGDKVEISGIVKNVKDGLYLYTDSLLLSGSNKLVYSSVLNNLEAQKYSLVEYTGEVMKNYSKSIDLEFGESTIRVSVLASTTIDMPAREVGDKLKVTGILIEEGEIFKILPRYQDDLEVLEQEIVQPVLTPVKAIETVDSVVSKPPAETSVINKLPSLITNKSPKSPARLVKYSIGRGWFFLGLLILLLILILIIFRKRILSYLRNLKIMEFSTKNIDLVNTKEIDFEKDKYELMFGNTS
ncbi:MAG: lamin tail domain-containing protein [Candidatus Dojkabacteria bacterium]